MMITSNHGGFAGVQPPAMYPAPGSYRFIRADIFLRAEAFPPEEKIQKEHHLRPRRLRRSTAARNASSSGQHSLIGVELPGAIRFS
ncbi:hypothetical protein SDC9_151870 [bioreactor metagenome]|uniref:Uncharacterized protein n=1 Tax=bioreactor metagenome TaxID=1076179 RepID=A0A645ERE9_9ZZZZ